MRFYAFNGRSFLLNAETNVISSENNLSIFGSEADILDAQEE